jgi:two-component system, OmpR family, sensor kinase
MKVPELKLPRSLRARTTFWYVCLLATTLTVFSAGMYVEIHHFLVDSLYRSQTGIAQTIALYDIGDADSKGQSWLLERLGESYSHMRSDRFVRLSSGSQILFRTNDMTEPYVSIDDIPSPPLTLSSGVRTRIGDAQQVVVSNVLVRTAHGHIYQVEAGATVHRMQQTLRSLAEALIACTTLIVFLASLGGYFLMERSLRPLALLTANAASIGHNRMGHRLPVLSTDDEIEVLTHSLNGMIDRLEDSLSHNRRFSADASHELRTPLAIMQGEIEDIIQFDNLPSHSVSRLESFLEELSRMSRIVNSLMAITRLDAGGEQLDVETFDLTTLVQSTVEQMQFVAEEKGIGLSCMCEREVCVHADRMRIKQVIVNLIDNAIKYTPATLFDHSAPASTAFEGTSIDVTVFTSSSSVHFKVVDHGIGIPPEALPYVFNRFYRADFARNRGAGGVGLGLAIVKAIITAHNGFIAIQSAPGRGTTVTVQIPASSLRSIQAATEPRATPDLQKG